jgi:hypothetical protein
MTSDRLVEAFDASAVPALGSPRSVMECLEKVAFVRRPGAAQQLRYTAYSLKL